MFNTLNKLTILRIVDDDKIYSRTTSIFLLILTIPKWWIADFPDGLSQAEWDREVHDRPPTQRSGQDLILWKQAKKNSTSIISFSLLFIFGSAVGRFITLNILYQLTRLQSHSKSLMFTHHHPHVIFDTLI